jgi:integrin alpha FG-GAP repeat containing protein 1
MSQDTSHDKTDMAVYFATTTGGFGKTSTPYTSQFLFAVQDTKPMAIPSSTSAQPVPLDIDGDLMVDMLGFDSTSPPMMKIWQNTWNNSDPSIPLFTLYVPCDERLCAERLIDFSTE